jgi:hypothetical protein
MCTEMEEVVLIVILVPLYDSTLEVSSWFRENCPNSNCSVVCLFISQQRTALSLWTSLSHLPFQEVSKLFL